MGGVKNKNSMIIFGLIVVSFFAYDVLLSSNIVSAEDSAVDSLDIVLPVSCSMSASGMTSHNAKIANGIYTPNIGTTTMNVFCNDNEGFSIYATGFTGNSTGEGSNKLIGTEFSDYSEIITGTATTAGDPDVSNWAMKLATDSYATYPLTILDNYDAYHAVPNTDVKVATRLSGTDVGTNAVGSTLTSTYAVYVSGDQPADTYTGQVKYTLVHPNDGNLPSDDLGIDQLTYMQDFASLSDEEKASVFDSMTVDAQYRLKDSRDQKDYYLAKLQDGNIWMTQNLDFDLVEGATLSSEDTDIHPHLPSIVDDENDNQILDPNYDPNETVYWTVNPQYATEHLASGASTSDAESVDVGNWYFTDQKLSSSQANFLTGNGGSYFSANPFSGNGAHGHVGNYYTQEAAVVAGYTDVYNTGSYDSDYSDCSGPLYTDFSFDYDGACSETQVSNPDYRVAFYINSICPAGWRLPRAYGQDDVPNDPANYKTDPYVMSLSEYYHLLYYYNGGGLYGGLNIEGSPAYFNRSGTFSNGVFKNAGYDGYYWSSHDKKEFFYRSTGADPYDFPYLSSYGAKLRSVRCMIDTGSQDTLSFTRVYFSPNQATLAYPDDSSYTSLYCGGDNTICFDGGAEAYHTYTDGVYDENNEYVVWVQIMRRGGTIKLASRAFDNISSSHGGYYEFTGWNTKSDGSGTSYADRADFTSGVNDENVILYAQWRFVSY